MSHICKWSIQGAACGVAAGIVLLLGGRIFRAPAVMAQTGVADVVRATRFDLVDDAGVTTAQLLTSKGQPGLVLGRSPKKRLVAGPLGLRVSGEFGYTVVSGHTLGAFADEHNGVSIGNLLIVMKRAGEERIVLNLIGGAAITLNDSSGRQRAVVGSHAWQNTQTGAQVTEPESAIALWDEEGSALFRAP